MPLAQQLEQVRLFTVLKAGALKACHWLVCGCSEDACLAADATPDGLQIACNIGPKL